MATSAGEILEAQRKAIGGARKRCRKGKSCSATCIQGMKVCLVSLSASVNEVISKAAETISGSKKKEPATLPEGTYKVRGKGEGRGRFREKTALEKAFKGAIGKELLEDRFIELKTTLPDTPIKELKKLAASQMRSNQKFASRLSNNLPQGVNVFYFNGFVVMRTRVQSGDKIEVVFSPRSGFHFTVNGTHDAGSVKTRKGQIQVASAVKTLYNATVRSLPEGAVLRTGAHMADGKGEKRVKIYNGLGFSLPSGENGLMFGKVGAGNTVSPTDEGAWWLQRVTTSAVYY